MKNKDREGQVMTGMNGFISRWKTENEDESNGHRALSELSEKYPSCILRPAGADDELMDCLISVSGNKTKTENRDNIGKKVKKNKEELAHTKSTLERNIVSAMTKYDSLDSHFAPENRMKEIINQFNF